MAASNLVALQTLEMTGRLPRAVPGVSSDPQLAYAVPTMGQTITMAAAALRLLLEPAGTLAALTLVLPPNPVDNQEVDVSSTAIITALTLQAGTGGASIKGGAPSSMTAGSGFRLVFVASKNAWYRQF